MPSIKENEVIFTDPEVWRDGGEDWSARWGSSEMEWFWTIFPRIHKFVPTDTILEIAPGYGRWTRYLKDLCKSLVGVDLVEECIEACKRRFRGDYHITYYKNDGKSLEMISDGSIDFAFSFDSLVHAEDDVLDAYLLQLSSKLKKDGIAFIHHSNFGEYRRTLSAALESYVSERRTKDLETSLGLRCEKSWLLSNLYRRTLPLVNHLGIEFGHGRASSMTAEKFLQHAELGGLRCISQEMINPIREKMIDCISIVTPVGSIWERPNRIVRNHKWPEEAKAGSRLMKLYGLWA